jgi:hypothetical protein
MVGLDWHILLCPRTHAKRSESLTFLSTREREGEREGEERERNYTLNVQCSVQYTLLIL